jgi:hypothetical protein
VSHHHLGSSDHGWSHAAISAPSNKDTDEHANDEGTNDGTNDNGSNFTSCDGAAG